MFFISLIIKEIALNFEATYRNSKLDNLGYRQLRFLIKVQANVSFVIFDRELYLLRHRLYFFNTTILTPPTKKSTKTKRSNRGRDGMYILCHTTPGYFRPDPKRAILLQPAGSEISKSRHEHPGLPSCLCSIGDYEASRVLASGQK